MPGSHKRQAATGYNAEFVSRIVICKSVLDASVVFVSCLILSVGRGSNVNNNGSSAEDIDQLRE
jgi:hypothetical protein